MIYLFLLSSFLQGLYFLPKVEDLIFLSTHYLFLGFQVICGGRGSTFEAVSEGTELVGPVFEALGIAVELVRVEAVHSNLL